MTYRTSGFPSTELPMQAILSIALSLTATQKWVNTKMANKIDIALCESAKPKTSVISYLTSKEPVCPRVELILKIIIILLIIFLGFIKSKPC